VAFASAPPSGNKESCCACSMPLGRRCNLAAHSAFSSRSASMLATGVRSMRI
jgi:hypothetical protein